MALSGLANRKTSTGLAPLSTKSSINRKTKPLPLFEPEEDELLPHSSLSEIDEDNEELAFAIQASMDVRSTTVQPSKMAPIAKPREVSPDDDDIYASPRRLDTMLSIANAGPSRIQASPSQKRNYVPTTFGKPTLLAPTSAPNISDSDDDWEEVVPQHKVAALVRSSTVEIECISTSNDFDIAATEVSESTTFQKLTMAMSEEKIDSDEEVDTDGIRSPEHVNELPKPPAIVTDSVIDTNTAITFTVSNQQRPHTLSPPPHYDGFEEAEAFFALSRSPSPSKHIPEDLKIESWDAAQEMDPHAEEGEFAKFMSHVKGKDLDDVRREIDVEIETLHQQRKAAMRDSEDITQQMITQIMVCLYFGGLVFWLT
jgi:DNA excision repair protein ERCC-5